MSNQPRRDRIIESFIKSGPWAVLSLLLLAGIGYTSKRIIDVADREVTRFVSNSISTTAILADSIARTNESLEKSNKRLELTSLQVSEDSVKIVRILTLMEDAMKKMECVPTDHKEIQRLLEELKNLIPKKNPV